MNSKENNETYKSLFKATSLFGGVQVYLILIGVIKSKIIALLLGPLGIGVQGLYVSAVELIKQFTSFGLSQSAVRDVSEAYGSNDYDKVDKVVSVLRRIVWYTGLLGAITMMVLSPVLSRLTFGSSDYTIPFLFLSTVLLIDQLTIGQKVVLQGLRKLKYLAKASAIGSTLGLLASIPLYYLLGIKGIVPTLILYSSVSLLFSWFYSKRITITNRKVNFKEMMIEGSGMIKMGLALSVSSMLVALSAYLLRGFIRYEGGTEEVGYFTAGFTIVNTYVAMVFNAMATDYYPRLAAVNHDDDKCRDLVSKQAEIGVLILAPMLCACILFWELMIRVLYTSDFLKAGNFILFAMLGMLFKLASWSISYIIIAKSESRLFVCNEIIQNVYTLLFNLIGYHYGGLLGLGISFTLCQVIYFIQVYIIAVKKYNFSFSASFWLMYVLQMAIVLLSLVIGITINDTLFRYIAGSFLLVISGYYSLKGLNDRTNFLSVLKNRIK